MLLLGHLWVHGRYCPALVATAAARSTGNRIVTLFHLSQIDVSEEILKPSLARN